MHKKPLVAVLLFGLLLVLPFGVTEARVDPGSNLTPAAQPLPYIARGLDKGPASAPTAFTDPSTNLQVGVSRTGATFCDGRWQGPTAFFIGGWLYGDEFYAAYQDPEELGSCAGVGGLYTFDVTAINWHVLVQVADIYHIQPIVYDVGGEIGCPVPGGVLCAGPVYALDFTGGGPGGYLLSLPFPTECCVFNPYFAGVYFADFIGPDLFDILTDAGPGVACQTYNKYSPTWKDIGEPGWFDLNLTLWSEGVGFDQNLCPGLPGICDFQAWYSNVFFFWQSPDGNGAEDYFTRFTGDVSCTLQTFRFGAYCPGTEGTEPTYRVTLFGVNGPVSGGRMYPQAFGVPFDPLDPNVVESFEFPFGSYVCYPDWTVVDFTDYAFGPGQDIIISVALSSNTPDLLTDIASVLTDDGASPKGRTGFYVGVLGDWFYMDEVFGSDYDMVCEAFICCEQVEASEATCGAPGPDDWNTFAHDYERTSSTTINVGDPCQVNPIWTADQPFGVNFTQATVANDRVYIANDQQNNVYNLLTGALINSISGLPHVFTSNRSNMTVDAGSVFMTGGSGQSVGRWDLDLAVNTWVNGVGGSGPPLGANVRFGAVTYVAGLDIVIAGSENAKLWAFDAATGGLYAGWATNPLILDANALHAAAYDGTNLYVGTALSGLDQGSIYNIDPATGAVNWNYNSGNGDGFPGGVSLDGADLYAASTFGAGSGFRYKLDKVSGAVVWSFGQQRSLYGPPAIGRNFIYCNLDAPGEGGIFAIDKNTGAPVHNFASDGVGQVSAHVTVTCDAYAFAGDRNGFWWLLDLVNFVPVWQIEAPFFSPVFGTAVSSNVLGDRNFAILSTQFGGPTWGMIAAYEFNSGARPLVNQNTYATTIGIEFGTLGGNPHNEPDVFINNGCAPLNFNAINLYDPAPDVTSSTFLNTQSSYAAALANRSVDANYNTYFEPGSITKSQLRLFDNVTPELSRYDQIHQDLSSALKQPAKRSTARMAAGSDFLRTSAVSVTTPLPAAATTSVDWVYDGTALERGVDVELIEFITDDPDRVLLGHQPILEVTYAGGCFSNSELISWNTGGAESLERLYNDGRMGDQGDSDDLDWMGAGTEDVYSAAFYLAGEWDSVAVPPIAQFSSGEINGNGPLILPTRQFLPDPWPGPDCEFRFATDVPMGFKRENGCPGDATPINGEWLRTAMIDTSAARVGTFGEAIGTRIEVTEVGAYDPLYGDFKLMRWIVINRDPVEKGPIYAGSWIDWDVAPNFDANTGFLGLSFNGYGIYDHATPRLAMGMFDPNLPTAYGGLDASFNTPQRINPMGERPDDDSGAPEGNYDGPWQSPDTNPQEEMWEYAISRLPAFEDGPQNLQDDGSPYEDHAGLLTCKGQMLPASDTIAFHQCLYGVDATSGDENTMEANGLALAQRAAKWAGFARGDVNDDNTVNLLDVCWLLSGHQIYPDTYNGDVDLSGAVDGADEAYLLNYVTGLGPAPLGDWRFTF